jgi:hypothetical protein
MKCERELIPAYDEGADIDDVLNSRCITSIPK